MRTEEALARLAAHQNAIAARMNDAVALTAGKADAVRVELAKARWELTRALRTYQIFKHTEIFDPAIAHGTPERAAAAREMKARCVSMSDAFHAYLLRWSREDVVGCWSEYKPAMHIMVDQIRSHITRERDDVHRLLAGSKRTRRHLQPA